MNYRKTWNLASIPDPVLASENGRRSAAKRKVRSGGRPMNCGSCGSCKQCELKRKRQALRFDPGDPGAPAQLLP